MLIAGAHSEVHDAVEAGRVGIVIKMGGSGATYVGVAADSVFAVLHVLL